MISSFNFGLHFLDLGGLRFSLFRFSFFGGGVFGLRFLGFGGLRSSHFRFGEVFGLRFLDLGGSSVFAF